MKLSLKVVERKKNMNLRRNRCIELILVILGLTVDYVSCSSDSYPREKRDKEEVGPVKPLVLTPFIMKAKRANQSDKARILEKARNLSKVTFPELPDIVSYAGYFTVEFSSGILNSFFWYFPAQVDSENAPVVLFIEPPLGDTGLLISLQRNGPFMLEGTGRLKKREESWNKKQNMIHIDTFINDGYSYWLRTGPYSISRNYLEEMLLGALRQFFELFPWLRENDFFVVGERWSGRHVTFLCNAIHQYNEKVGQDKKINLKGMAVGNAWLHPGYQSNIAEYLHESGLIDAKGKEIFLAKEEHDARNPKNKFPDAEAFNILVKPFFDPSSKFLNTLTGYKAPFNILEDRPFPKINYIDWFRKESTYRALHIGNASFTEYPTHPKFIPSGKSRLYQTDIITVLKNFRVLIYTGNLDFFCSYPNVENWINELTEPSISIDEIKRAERQKWIVDGELAGYIREGGNLTEVLIRNAGHYPAIDQPKWNRQLIESFTHGLL